MEKSDESDYFNSEKKKKELSRHRSQKVFHFILETHNNPPKFIVAKIAKMSRRGDGEESTIVIKATGRYSEKVKWMGIDKGHDPQDGEQIDRQCKKTVNYLKNLPRPFCAEDSVFLKA